MRRLIREGDPPAGQLASPVPQYWNPNTETFEDVLGAHGAPRAILYGPNGQPISQSNPLEVRVRELEAELAAMRGMLETGNAKVTLSGQIATGGAGLRYINYYKILAPDETDTVADWDKGDSVEIIRLEVSASHPQLQLNIRPYFATGGLANLNTADASGNGFVPITIANIVSHGSSMFDRIVIDEALNRYKVGTTVPMPMVNGGDITVHNRHVDSCSVSVFALVREVLV